jgi:ribose/xylose/arabinose/galactoside ABC-type transport system permease subunit
MMPLDFPEYAALWREQIDPKELAELQAMATKIKRTAAWRWLFDQIIGFLAVGAIAWVILLRPGAPLIKAGLALLVLPTFWYLWRWRRRITRDSRAIAVDDPRIFFDAAIENVRAETRLYTLSAWLTLPLMIAVCLLLGAAYGFAVLYANFISIVTLASPKLAAIAALIILGHIYLFRDNLRMRGQLRRLEAMRREWNERDPGDEP